MKKMLVIAALLVSIFLSSCDVGNRVETAIRGNGNGCNVTACTNQPVKCNYDIISGKCK